MANLPRAVQRQVEAAENLLAEANKPTDPAPQENPPAPAPVEPAPQVEPQAQEVAPAPQPAPAPPSNTDYEQKFKTLQGIMASEVRTAQQTNKELTAKLNEALARVEQLSKAAPAPEPQQRPTLDPKDVDAFGQDLVDMVHRQIHSTLGRVTGKLDGVVADFEKRIAHLEQSLKGTTQTVAMTAEEVFFTKLTAAVPDWEQINADERFLGWLSETDPVYGQPRQSALTAAQQSMDAGRVANIFRTFKALIAPPTQPKTDPLAKQVSPKSSAPAAPAAPTEKPVITQQQVQAFYRDVAAGRYRGREAEQQRLEAIVNEAIAEGRIQ